MDMFAPESREQFEKYKENQIFSEKMEKQIKDKLKNGQEIMPDIIVCPNKGCRNPLKVDIKKDVIELYCANCGWEKKIKKDKCK